MEIKAFFDKDTFTITYVVNKTGSNEAVIIDPVLDYDPKSSTITSTSAQEIIRYLSSSKLTPKYVLETHAHADHLSGSQVFKEHFPGLKVAIGEKITVVQDIFKGVFNLGEDFKPDGSQFDELIPSGGTVKVAGLELKDLYTPGHTPACSSYLIGDNVFTGDALFMPDYGTGRADFPGGSAEDLYDSVTKQLYTLPNETRVFVGHDYMPGGRDVKWETTIGESKKSNIRLRDGVSKDDFVKARRERDSQLEAPRLLLQSVQFNIQAGVLPQPESNGTSYFKIPIRHGD